MILVCGVHGVGKTAYCEQLSKQLKIPAYSASQLISMCMARTDVDKRVMDIGRNQQILLEEVQKLRQVQEDMILDGHLCLFNQSGAIERIPVEIFQTLQVQRIDVIVDQPRRIAKRLQQRDQSVWPVSRISAFQQEEVRYARELSRALHIPYHIRSHLAEREEHSADCILLSIKPEFAEKILLGEKKYEYRKRLCARPVKKILLYASAPKKAIVGEVEVCGQYTGDKAQLWEQSKQVSGISYEYYDRYFQNTNTASAYLLGQPRRYQKPLQLEEIGIFYHPQSFVYVDEI